MELQVDSPVYPDFASPPGGKGPLDLSPAVEAYNDIYVEYEALDRDLQSLIFRKREIEGLLALERRDRVGALKAGNPALYRETQETVAARVKDSAFKIKMGIWLPGFTLAMGLAVAGMVNIASSTVAASSALVLPAVLVLGAAASRLYRAASKGPLKGYHISKALKERGKVIEDSIPAKASRREQLIDELADRRQAIMGMSIGESGDVMNIYQEEEYIDIDGIKLRTNPRLMLILQAQNQGKTSYQ